MKKLIWIVVAAIVMMGALFACTQKEKKQAEDTKKIKVVTTIFPEYDWVKAIVGDRAEQVELTMLLDNGVDLHSYQPTAEDIMKIATCDLFIYVGGESDVWVEDALKESSNKDRKVINLLEVLGDNLKEEEVVEGMQAEEEEEEGTEEETPEYDEHVWLSRWNAMTLTQKISETMQRIDPGHAGDYKENTTAYVEKLKALNEKYKQAVADGKQNTLLFGDRFPFRYLVDDYNLSYYAAFVGCSAESEASFETIHFLAKKVDELSLPVVLTIEGKEHKIAETIVKNTKGKNQKILTMDSMQATMAEDVEKGTTYLSVMEKNLDLLKDALQ